MGWQDEIRPGDIVLFNLPEQNPTTFGKLVLYFQNIVKANNRKTHAAMVVDAGEEKPKLGDMALKVIDIEFGRKASTYFIPRKYGDIDIYRLFNSQQSYTSPDGDATIAQSEDISRKAAEIALSYTGARYSVKECLAALDIHKTSQEHIITEGYISQLRSMNKDSPFMCVSFVLTCYQQACLDILGGLPPPFLINAHTSPRYFAHHIETSGHFKTLPRAIIREILATGDPVYRTTSSRSRFSWFHRGQESYQPLLAGGQYEDSIEDESENNAAGVGVNFT